VPGDLSVLVPKLLANIPEDPFDGAPLRYRKLTPGYVVYSLGPDGTDEGGTERGGPPNTGVLKLPAGKKGVAGAAARKPANRVSSNVYDVTFTVER
jgi:hypothetical protein